jgi:hypothetical protein
VIREIAVVLGLSIFSFAAMSDAGPLNRSCDSSLEIGTVSSLIPLSRTYAQGTFSYRKVDYSVKIRNWDAEPASYAGVGVVCGLGAPADIEGLYTVDPHGEVWRNKNGVQIDMHPPLPVLPSPPELEIKFAGAVLPRQPY